MSNEKLNMYQQIVDMELHDLENKVIDLQNLINNYSVILEEMWAYHPANPNFINPIKGYDEMKKIISGVEKQIDDLELKIKTLKSAN